MATRDLHCLSMRQIVSGLISMPAADMYNIKGSSMACAFQVVCTGKEERLLDCDFPQDFGEDYSNNVYGGVDNASAPTPRGGLPSSGCARSDNRRLSVICRRFEITGTALLTVYCVPLHSHSLVRNSRALRWTWAFLVWYTKKVTGASGWHRHRECSWFCLVSLECDVLL